MRTVQSLKLSSKQVFNRQLKLLHKDRAAVNKETQMYQLAFDLPLINMTKRLAGIRKKFKNIAFIGPNPYLFLQHMPKNYEVEKFYFCEASEASVQKSYDIITQRLENGFFDKTQTNVPDEMIPIVVDEETQWLERFQEGQLDLIVNNMSVHWVNELQQTFKNFQHTLEPDGVFMASAFGGDTLQEMRICFNLAEQERDGGVSPIVSPMMSVTDLGNTFSRCKFTMPTIDIMHTSVEFTSAFALFHYLQTIGEQSSMHEGQRRKSLDTFVAAAALMQTLFNRETSPINETTIHIDTLKDWYIDNELSKQLDSELEDMGMRKPSNIVCTFDVINLIGWKFHESQQKAKERGSGKFSLKEIVTDMNDKAENEDQIIRHGTIIDDGDNVREE